MSKIKSEIERISGLCRRVLLFFFWPNVFEKEVLNRSLPGTTDIDPDQLTQLVNNFRELRSHVFKALKNVLIPVIPTLLFASFFRFAFDFHLPHSILNVMKIIAYILILWGVFSELGNPFRTWKGNTLTEIFDGEWHKFVYMLGVILLIASYIFEINP